MAKNADIHMAALASAIGNATEWFDYGIFTSGAMAGIIGDQFFPGHQHQVLKSLALVAVGFLVRPLGGLFFGPLGDKLGRRRVLAATILLMSSCTFLVGLLPGYGALGPAAPAILLVLRLVQGFSTGGEYGGAATFIAEYAPTRRRGFFGSFLELGTLAGYVGGNGLVLAISLAAGADGLRAWAWRIPFLLALPLGGIGLYLRSRLDDTPTFRRARARGEIAGTAPIRETVIGNWRRLLDLIGIVFLLNVADYMLLTTMPSYVTEHLHMAPDLSLEVMIGVELAQMALIVPLGALSDRIGRKPLLLAAAIGMILISYPAIRATRSGTLFGLAAGLGAMALLLALMLAVVGSTFPAMFPTRIRYGSFAIGYNLSTSMFGGTCGVLTEMLIDSTGDPDWPAYYLIFAGLVALMPILQLRETARVPISVIDAEQSGEG